MAVRKATSEGAVSGELVEGAQTIEQLQQRYQQLHTRKIQCDTKLDQARKQLEDLKREAREKYDTDDVAELQAKLAAMKADNEEKRGAYQAQLEGIERELSQVEQNYQATEAAAKGGA
jgi:chromosome segregation ATPase